MAMGVVLFVLGAAVGATGVWLLMRRYRLDLAAREAEIARDTAVREVELRALVERHDAEVERLQERLATEAEQHRMELAAAQARVELVRGDREQLRRDVQAVSADVLRKTGEALARENTAQRLAEQERAAGELGKRTEEIKRIVGRRGEARTDGERDRPAGAQRREADGRLSEMVRPLGDGVGRCARRPATSSALRSARRRAARGARSSCATSSRWPAWSSTATSSSRPHVHTDDGRTAARHARPAAGRQARRRRLEGPARRLPRRARGEGRRRARAAAARHARQTREHITKLASKGYQRQFDATPEFVVMFVPSDGIYQAALAADPALIEYGVEQQVLIATPTTLIGLLRAVHYGWRQELIAESAREIAEPARELHRRLGRFVEPLAKVGRQLESAVAAYNEAVGSFDHRVVPQVRRIEEPGPRRRSGSLQSR